MAYVKNVLDTTAITGAFLNSDDTALDDQRLRHRPPLVRHSRHEELVSRSIARAGGRAIYCPFWLACIYDIGIYIVNNSITCEESENSPYSS